MKLIEIIIILAAMTGLAMAQMASSTAPQTAIIHIQTDAGGNFSEQTSKVVGEILAIQYVKGNITAAGTIVIKDAQGIQLDSYNVSTGNAYRLPGIKILGSTDAYEKITPAGKLWANMTSQQANKTATVKIVYR